MRARAKFLHPELSTFYYYLNEITYMPFDDAMLKKSLLVYHSPRIRVVLGNHHSANNTNPEHHGCIKNWPRTIFV